MDLLSQVQKFGNVKAGLPPAFTQVMPTTLALSGSVLNNAGIGGLILRAYTEVGNLPNSASYLPEPYAGRPISTLIVKTLNFNLASFSGQNSNYSLRITGYIQPPQSARYTFKVICDDAARMYINDYKLIDSWTFVNAQPATITATCFLNQGQYVPFLIEHSATGGSQQLTVQWSTDGTNFYTLNHASDITNFSLAFDAGEYAGVRTGTLRVSGKTVFNSTVSVQSPRKSLIMISPPYIGSLSGSANISNDLSASFVISLWLKHSSASSVQTILSFGGNRHIQINQFNQVIISPANGVSVSASVLAINVPNHLIVYLNPSNQFALYVNGSLDGNYNGSYSATSLAAPSGNTLAFGGTSALSSTNLVNINTLIADVAIWNVATFTANEALKLYNGGRRFNIPTDLSTDNTGISTLYLYYGFDNDSASNKIIDSGPASRHLNLTNSSTVITSPALIVNSDSFNISDGKIHTNNRLSIGSPSTLAPLTVIGTFNSLYNGALLAVQSIGTQANAGISITSGVGSSYPGGNSFLTFDQKNISGWSIGQDVADSAKFKICNTNSLTSASLIAIDQSGRVGIGKTSPSFSLDVAGNINFSGSLFQGGTAYISSQWVSSGNNLYFPASSSAFVGINTSTPSQALDVAGSGRFTGSLTVAALTGTLINSSNILASKLGIGVSGVGQMLDIRGVANWGQARLIPQSDNSESSISFYRYSNLSQAASGDTWILGHQISGIPSGSFGFGCFAPSGFVNALSAANNGFIGIGKTNPGFALDVNGNINFSGNLFQGGVQYVGSQWTSSGTNLYYASGAVGIGTSNPAFILDVLGSSRISSLTTNLINATSLNVVGSIVSNSVTLTGNLATSTLSSNVITSTSLNSLAITGSTLSLTSNLTTSGVISNNVYGSLLGRFYDESGIYTNLSLSPGSSLPSAFNTRPLLDSQISSINLNNFTVGTLSSNYSLRIAGYIQPPSTGTYLFRMTGQEGYSLYIAGQKIFNNWIYSGSSTSSIGTLTMYNKMWSPISVEHVCLTSGEKLLLEVSPSNGTYTTLIHGSNTNSFQFSYEYKEVPPVSFGSLYVNGSSDFADTAVFENGIALPNSSYFSGNTSELNNDALYLKSSGLSYLSVANSLTASSVTASSFTSLYSSITNMAFASTLSVGTILNFSAGGTLGTNLTLSGTLTCASISTTFLNAATLSAGTYLNVVFNQTISSAGTTSGSFSSGTLTVGGGGSFMGTIISTGIGVNQTNLSFPLDVNGSARTTGSLTAAGNLLSTLSGRSYIFNSGIISNAVGSQTDVGSGNVGIVFSSGGNIDLVNSSTTSVLRAVGSTVGINTQSPYYSLDVNGSARIATGLIVQSFNRTFDTTTNGVGSIASFTGSTGSFNFDIDVIISGNSQTFAAQYKIAAGYNAAGTTWKRCMPLGAWNQNLDEYELQMINTAGNLAITTFRLVHSNANTASRVAVNIICRYNQNDVPTVSDLTSSAQTTDSNWSSYGYLSTTTLTQRGGNVGINTNIPAYNLDVAGSAHLSTLVCDKTCVTGSVILLPAVAMTSNSTAGFICTASGTNGGRQVYYLFDRTTTNCWAGVGPYNGSSPYGQLYSGSITTNVSGSVIGGEWVQLQCPAAYNIVSYTVTDTNQRASAWTIAGSNDASTWTYLDSRATTSVPSASTVYSTVASNTAFLYLRYIVTVVTGYNVTDQAELAFNAGTGLVGVNNSTPSYQLDVTGSTRVSGNLSVAGFNVPKMQFGTIFVSNSTYTAFPTPFSGIPIVTVTYYSASSQTAYTSSNPPGNSYLIQAGVYNVSSAGFGAQIIYISNGSSAISNTGSAYFTWIAVGT